MPRFVPGLATRLVLLLVTIGIYDIALPATPGHEAPATILPDIRSGEMLRLSDLKGNVVYVDFWASWCPPCRQSLPLYEAMQKRMGNDRFQILAINLDEERGDAEHFIKRHPVSYEILLDPSGNSARDWGVTAMPSSYLVDPGGIIKNVYFGFEPSHIEVIEHDIKTLLLAMPVAGTGVTNGLHHGTTLGTR